MEEHNIPTRFLQELPQKYLALALIRSLSDVEKAFLFSDLAALTLKPPNRKIKKAFQHQERVRITLAHTIGSLSTKFRPLKVLYFQVSPIAQRETIFVTPNCFPWRRGLSKTGFALIGQTLHLGEKSFLLEMY